MQETLKTWVQSLGWEDPLEEGMATHSVFLPGKSHGQRSLVGYSPQHCKESDPTEGDSIQLDMPSAKCSTSNLISRVYS